MPVLKAKTAYLLPAIKLLIYSMLINWYFLIGRGNVISKTPIVAKGHKG
jgi:hypothetical protein